MNKEQAKEALQEGNKIRHTSQNDLQWLKKYRETTTHYLTQGG
jgi:hypothetical protein